MGEQLFELLQYVFAMHRMTPRQAYHYQNRVYTCPEEFSLIPNLG